MIEANDYGVVETASHVFFWKPPCTFGQWSMVPLDIDGTVYCCNEQYMMSQKARLFNDHETYDKIMDTQNPKDHKTLGRAVKNFDADKWNEACRQIVYRANYAKFTQHPKLQDRLLATGSKMICEASATDAIWGIGLEAKKAVKIDPSRWTGTNWLGIALMQVRDAINDNVHAHQR